MDTTPILAFFTDFFAYGKGWNSIIVLLIFCSIITVTLFIERLIVLKQSETKVNHFIILLREQLDNGELAKAIHFCESSGGALGHIIKAGLLKKGRNKEQIEQAVEIAGMIEISRLEKNAKILSIIAHIAPLIGLLGTVLGFIQAFSEMRLSGLVDISATRIGTAMEYALITTAAGLVVAIPTILAYNYIVSRIENFVLEIQIASSEILDLLTEDYMIH